MTTPPPRNSMREKGLEPSSVFTGQILSLFDAPAQLQSSSEDGAQPGTEAHPKVTGDATAHVTRDPEKAAAFHREWRNGPGREKFVAAVKAWQQRNPEKRRAHWAVDNALRSGKLVKGPCEVGGACAGRIEAHHDDYSRPLDVRWVCKGHHRSLDVARREGAA